MGGQGAGAPAGAQIPWVHASRRRRGEEKTRQAARLLADPVPSSAAGARTGGFRPLQLPEAEARGASSAGAIGDGPRHLPEVGFSESLCLRGRAEKVLFPLWRSAIHSDSPPLLLRSLPFGVSPSPGLGEDLSGPRSLLFDGLFLLCFLLCLLHLPISACSLHSVPISFHRPTWNPQC